MSTHCAIMLIDIFVNCNWVNTRWQCYSTHNQYIEQHNNNRTTQITSQHNNNRKTIAQHNDNYFWRVRTVPRLVSLTLVFALQLRKKHGKTSVRMLGGSQDRYRQLLKIPLRLGFDFRTSSPWQVAVRTESSRPMKAEVSLTGNAEGKEVRTPCSKTLRCMGLCWKEGGLALHFPVCCYVIRLLWQT